MGVLDWSLSAARNALVDPLVRAIDGASARDYPGMVRGVMMGVRALADDHGGAILTGGVANAYTARTSAGVSELRSGLRLLLCVDRGNTDAASLNADGTGPKPWLSASGDQLAVGALRKGRFVAVVYDAALDAWRSDAGAAIANVDLSAAPGLTLKGNAGAGTATPADLTVGQTRSLLAVDRVDNTSDATKAQQGNPIGDALASKALPAQITAAVGPLATAINTLTAGQSSATLAYDTLAQLNANVAPADGVTAQVINDGANSGFYAKAGASGVGTWVKKSTATVPALDAGVQLTQGFSSGVADLDAPGALAPPRFNFNTSTGVSVLQDLYTTLLLPFMGQSLAEGTQPTGPNPISTTVRYPGRALMPATGARFFDAFKEGSASGADYGYFDELIGARETLEASGLSESPVSGFVNHFTKLIDDAFPTGAKCRVASFVAARGGTQLLNLKEGSNAFRQILRGVQLAVDAEARKGRTVVVPGVNWIQGEADVLNPAYSEIGLELLRRALSARIKAITGQSQEVMLFLAQTNSVNSGVSAIYQRVQLRQLLAAQRYPFIRLVGPLYPWPMEQSSNVASSQVHKSAVGTNRIGMMFARRVFDEICGVGCIAFAPTNAFMVNPNLMQVEFDVPFAPLVMDTSDTTIRTAGIPGYYGFEVFAGGYPPAQGDAGYASGSIAVTAHQIFAPTILRLQLASNPTTRSLWLAYAWRRNDTGATTPDGPVTGARGCLRDSTAHVSLMDGVTSQNWCNAFCMPVNAF